MKLLNFLFFIFYFNPIAPFEMESIGRAVRGQLGTLYNLRNKLEQDEIKSKPNHQNRIYEPTENNNNNNNNNNHNKPGRKKLDLKSKQEAQTQVTSFLKKLTKAEDNYNNENKIIKNNEKKSPFDFSLIMKILGQGSALKNLIGQGDSLKALIGQAESIKGLLGDSDPLKSLIGNQDLLKMFMGGNFGNPALLKSMTPKLLGMLDKEVSGGMLKPLKHLVSTGNQMVDFWDKQTKRREGNNRPKVLEMLLFGVETLKKYRDGEALKSSDPAANLTSASKALIQGMATVRKLTNRVIGLGDDLLENRGGGYGYASDNYASAGGHYGQSASYGNYLDPYSILAALGSLVFLFNVLFNLLNQNATGRSLDVSDIDVPLFLSDIGSFISRKGGKSKINEYIQKSRPKRTVDAELENEKMIEQKMNCAKAIICRMTLKKKLNKSSLDAQLKLFGIQMLDENFIADYMKFYKEKMKSGEKLICKSIGKECKL